METKIGVSKEKQYTVEGMFDMKSTYVYMKDYIENKMYYDLTEKEYEEKNKAKGRKLICKFQAQKMLNDDYELVIKGTFTLSGDDTIVDVNGKKMTLTKGKGKIAINSFLDAKSDVDPAKSPFKAFLDKIYKKYIGQDDLGNAMFTSAQEVGRIIDSFKQQLGSFTK